MKVGVLALQGDVREHRAALLEAGADPVEVRRPDDLSAVDAIVLPGGESTTLSMLLESSGVGDALSASLAEGLPAFGTCAGMILLARQVVGGRPDQRSFGVVDITVRRNGFGRQVQSFECDLAVEGTGPVRAVFIRAPVVERVGPDVEVLATVDGPGGPTPVLCRQGPHVVSSFHPELSGDRRIHELFLSGLRH
ncbi:MAG TPA: pyridoxal 5'-phosphate synthase glutaminase subunit PdxT [Acidimicrobiales bacterium]|nr:pyridoxal 5'-phosphate synthase glutaminase subunit PdxT [Acidimicrobiales bacterium]